MSTEPIHIETMNNNLYALPTELRSKISNEILMIYSITLGTAVGENNTTTPWGDYHSMRVANKPILDPARLSIITTGYILGEKKKPHRITLPILNDEEIRNYDLLRSGGPGEKYSWEETETEFRSRCRRGNRFEIELDPKDNTIIGIEIIPANKPNQSILRREPQSDIPPDRTIMRSTLTRLFTEEVADGIMATVLTGPIPVGFLTPEDI